MERKPYQILGRLEGLYEKLLATKTSVKSLHQVLHVGGDKGETAFKVTLNGDVRMYQRLPVAILAYDQDEHTEEGHLPV